MRSGSLILRASAVTLGLAGGGVYAASQGFFPMPGGTSDTPATQAATSLLPPAPQAAASPAALGVPVIATPASEPTVAVMLPVSDDVPMLDAMMVEAAPEAETPPARPLIVTEAAPEPQIAPMTDAPALSPLGLPCGLTVEATAQPAAMVALDIMDPCQPETALRVEHSGMTIEAMTDAMGLLTLDIPAFETPAFFTVRMDDESERSLLVPVPDLGDYDRIGIAWTGAAELDLHAMEFGARFGEDGHVWSDNPRGADAARNGEGGFLVQLGDPSLPQPMLAQVYTLPRATLSEANTVRLSLDAEITEANCGTPTEALTLRSEAAGRVDVTPLTFTHPGCDAVGDFLVLQNLLGDLRLASN
jgi:hypothetical protein